MNDRTDLEQLIDESAAQAGEDVIRSSVERQIDGQPWAQARWRELLRENDCFRRELAVDLAPKDLESRLLSIATPVARIRRKQRVRVFGWILAVAALFFVSLTVIGVSRYQNSARLQTVALLAINNHLNHMDDHGVTPHPNGRDSLVAGLSEEVEFGVVIPRMNERLHLVGGRKCKLGTHTVAFMLWTGDDGEYSLFQFQPGEFGIPMSIRPRLVHMTGPAGDEHPCGAWIWSDRSAGFVLVGDPDCDLSDLQPYVEDSNGS